MENGSKADEREPKAIPEEIAPATTFPGDENDALLKITKYGALFLVLFGVALFTRFTILDEMAFHHDESLYARYCWNFYTGGEYHYDPLQHGPLMFHLSLINFFMFGVSDTAARMMPAIFGVLLIWLVWGYRHVLGRRTAVILTALFVISPTIMYFSRFFRHDIYFVYFSVATPLAFLLYQKTKKLRFLYLTVVSLVLLFCIKENAFIVTLTYGSFLVLHLLVRFFSTRRESEDKPAAPFFGHLKNTIREYHDAYPVLFKGASLLVIWGFLFTCYGLFQMTDKTFTDKHTTGVKSYFIACLAFVFLLQVVFVVFESKWEKAGRPGNRSWFKGSFLLFICFFIFFGVFFLLYTTFFVNVGRGFWQGVYGWFVYWFNQHDIERIQGPFHYFIRLMFLYELLAVVVVIIAALLRFVWQSDKALIVSMALIVVLVAFGLGMYYFAYGSGDYAMMMELKLTKFLQHFITINHHFDYVQLAFAGIILIILTGATIDCLKKRQDLKAFFFWWTMCSFLIYSKLQEKVPWLLIHIITPMLFLAAIYLNDLIRYKGSRAFRNILLGLVIFMGAYSLRSAILLVYYNPDESIEQMVYVQTTPDIPKMLKEVERIRFDLGIQRKKDMQVTVTGDAAWPLSWYMRDYQVSWGMPTGPDKAIVICDWEKRKTLEEILIDYDRHRYRLRDWYIPNRDQTLKPRSGNWVKNVMKYVLYREPWDFKYIHGSKDFCFFVARDFDKFRYWEALPNVKSGAPQVVSSQGLPKGVRPKIKSPDLVFGSPGKAPGRLSAPRDIEVDSQGNIFVVEHDTHRVSKFDPEGKLVLTWGKAGQKDGEFKNPIGLGIDKDDNIYVCDTWNHRIQVFSNAGEYITQWGNNIDFYAPKDIFIDDQFNCYVADTGHHLIHKYDRMGRRELKRGGGQGNGRGQLFEPVGLALDVEGKLYVCDTGNKRINVYDSELKFLRKFSVPGWDNFYTEPFIDISPDNNLYVSDASNNHIYLLNSAGTIFDAWGKEGGQPGFVKEPKGVKVFQGRLYITDSLNGRVQRIPF